MTPQQPRCENCRFWELVDEQDYPTGICHRYPPVPVDQTYDNSRAPAVSGGDWCGEWQEEKATGYMTDKERLVAGIRYHSKHPPDKPLQPTQN